MSPDQYKEMIAQQHAARARADLAKSFSAREKEELSEKLLDGMQKGEIEPWRFGMFARDPVGALVDLAPHVAQKYGLPTFETLSKSGSDPSGFLNTGVTRDQISERLQEAVARGVLIPSVLSAFDSRPEQTLNAIPDEVAKAFSIPKPGTEELRKSKSTTIRLRDVDVNEFERETRRNGLWRS